MAFTFFRRRSVNDIWTDEIIKRKKPCTVDHVIASTVNIIAGSEPVIPATTAAVTATITTNSPVDEQLCMSMSPTEEPVQMSHKRLPTISGANPQPLPSLSRRPDDMRASMLIDRYVDQICMNDGTIVRSNGGPGDRLSIVSPLAKRLADIRLRRRSPASAMAKRKRSFSFSDDDDGGDCPLTTTPFLAGRKRHAAARWWQNSAGLTLPDGLPSPFHSARRGDNRLHMTAVVPPSPITPLRRPDPDSSDDCWKTPVGPSLIACTMPGDSLLSNASSKTADDDEIICCSDPRSPAILDETFTLKSRRCLSFVSPPPSDKKKNRRSLKKSTAASASDKGKP